MYFFYKLLNNNKIKWQKDNLDINAKLQHSVFSVSTMRPLDVLHAPHLVASAPCKKLVKQSAVPENFKLSTQKQKIELTLLATIFLPERKQDKLIKKKLQTSKLRQLNSWRKERDLSPPSADGESGNQMVCTTLVGSD